MKNIVWFALFLFIGASCLDQPDCFRQDKNLIGISFNKMFDGKADTVSLFFVSPTGTLIPFKNYDTVRTSTASLPLNFLKNQTEFVIKYLSQNYLDYNSKQDTVVVSHTSTAQFVSEDCGERFIVSNLALLRSTFDSVRVVSTTPSNPAVTNIVIYRCPRTNILRMRFRQLYMDETDITSAGKVVSRPIDLISNSGYAWLKDTILNSVLLPLDPSANTTTYDFKLIDDVQKKLTLNYDTSRVTILPKCGKQNVYSNLKVDAASTFGNLLVVRKDTLQDPPATNLELFRCPITNQIKINFKQVKASSRITDTLNVVSVKADFLPDSILNTQPTFTSITLPLNPAAETTTFTFEVNGEATSTLTLQVTYKTTEKNYHTLCGTQILFTALDIDKTNTAFYTDLITILDPTAKFPAVTNIEIVRK